MSKETSPLDLYIRRNIKGIHYTVSQAAVECGKSVDTLRRWRRTGFFVPSVRHEMGDGYVYLYTEGDMAKLMDIVGRTKRGRKLSSIEK